MWQLIQYLVSLCWTTKPKRIRKPQIRREQWSVQRLRAEERNAIRWDVFRRSMCWDSFNCSCGHCWHSCYEEGCDMSWKKVKGLKSKSVT